MAVCFAPRDVVGAALKTLGLGYNSSAADIRRCGLSEQDVRTRVQRLVKQVRWRAGRDVAAAVSCRAAGLGSPASQPASCGAEVSRPAYVLSLIHI